MKFAIKSRWTSSLKFEAKIDCAEGAPTSVKIGLAVKWALRSNADLRNADLRDADLRNAVLRDADLSGAVLSGAVLRGADLRNADFSDADLRDADLSGADFSDAVLSGADLSGADLRGADLRNADFSDADLRDADLSGAVLSGADLSGADLSDADLPIIKNIHQEIYAAASQPSALDMKKWHVCDTTHCRGGWAVFLAGPAGKDLEETMGTAAAASLIYMASDPHLDRVPDFYSSNADALADMARLAEAEKARS